VPFSIGEGEGLAGVVRRSGCCVLDVLGVGKERKEAKTYYP
jgi:hypothetical protein